MGTWVQVSEDVARGWGRPVAEGNVAPSPREESPGGTALHWAQLLNGEK